MPLILSLSALPSCASDDATAIDLRNPDTIAYLEAKSEKDLCEALLSAPWGAGTQNVRIEIEDEEISSYSIDISESEDFDDFFTLTTYRDYFCPSCLMAGKTYYFRVSRESEPENYIQKGKIKTKDTAGYFYSVDGLFNVRDIGGWTNNQGMKAKRGKIIRGGKTNNFEDAPLYTSQGYELLTKALKINGEIDLRGEADNYGQTHNFLGEEKPYIQAPFTTCNYILPFFHQDTPIARSFDERTPSSFKKIFSLLSDENNYPIYIHCNAGADRTGTICMILEAILDYPLDVIYKDIELSTFATDPRLRSQIDSETMTFSPTGVYQDDNANYIAFGKCVKDLWEEYGKGKTFKEAVENYLQTVCGVTSEEIASFRKIMLG